MFGDLFDSPWKIAIIAILIIVLFGARKLPVAARELGKSMRILKKEVSSLHDDDEPNVQDTPPAPAQLSAAPPAAAAPDAQTQIDALSKQLADLQASVDAKDSAQAK